LPFESVTVADTAKGPAVVGLPLILIELDVSEPWTVIPGGNPLVVQVYDPLPPLALRVEGPYEEFTVPEDGKVPEIRMVPPFPLPHPIIQIDTRAKLRRTNKELRRSTLPPRPRRATNAPRLKGIMNYMRAQALQRELQCRSIKGEG
jgi:hypothetical protein